MILKSLLIRREEWGAMKGKLQGEIEYQNVGGKISVALNDEDCTRLLGIVADAMVKTSQTLANELTANILTATAQIGHQNDAGEVVA